MSTCKKVPRIATFDVPADPDYLVITLPQTTTAFVLRPRTAVGVKVALDASPGAYFSLAAGETYSEDPPLLLDGPLKLRISAASAVTVEVWTWEG